MQPRRQYFVVLSQGTERTRIAVVAYPIARLSWCVDSSPCSWRRNPRMIVWMTAAGAVAAPDPCLERPRGEFGIERICRRLLPIHITRLKFSGKSRPGRCGAGLIDRLPPGLSLKIDGEAYITRTNALMLCGRSRAAAGLSDGLPAVKVPFAPHWMPFWSSMRTRAGVLDRVQDRFFACRMTFDVTALMESVLNAIIAQPPTLSSPAKFNNAGCRNGVNGQLRVAPI